MFRVLYHNMAHENVNSTMTIFSHKGGDKHYILEVVVVMMMLGGGGGSTVNNLANKMSKLSAEARFINFSR